MFIVIIKMTDYQKFLYKKYLMLLDEYFGASGKNNSIKVRFSFFLFNGGEVIAEVLIHGYVMIGVSVTASHIQPSGHSRAIRSLCRSIRCEKEGGSNLLFSN